MVLDTMTTTIGSVGAPRPGSVLRPGTVSRPGSVQSSDGRETKKYLLLRDTVAKCQSSSGSSRSRLLSKRSEQRVLKGSLWQEAEGYNVPPFSPPQQTKSLNRSMSMPMKHSGPPMFKQLVESLEVEDLTLQCASAILAEISPEICSLLLAIPTSEERYYIHYDTDRLNHAQYINVGSDVIVSKRNIPPCRALVKWKGRLAGKQGIWFGVEIMDEQSRGSGDSDGSVNNIRLFNCEKNNGMVVNIGQITLVPPKPPKRRPKKKAPSTPSLSSENNYLTNGSQLSDQYTNDLVSQTESELSFDDMNSTETAPLVTLQVGDRVSWPSDHGSEKATVRWIGTLPEDSLHGEILVGVEFDNPIGKGTGRYKSHRLFESRRGHASLVPLDGLVRLSSTSPSPRCTPDTSSERSLSRTMQEYECPAEEQVTADDILSSLALDERKSEPELSDHNNNSSGSSGITHEDRAVELTSSPCNELKPMHESPDSSFELPTSSTPAPIVNGVVNVDVASPHNLVQTDKTVDKPNEAPVSELSNSNHLSASAASHDSQSDGDDSSGWTDSVCSTSSEHISASKPVRLVRGKVASYHMSKAYASRSPMYSTKPALSRNKSKGKNGLVRMHSLDIQDMHDIAGDLELASSHESMAENSLDERPRLARDNLPSEPVVLDMTDSTRTDNTYVIARLSESPPNPLMESDSDPLSSPTRTLTSDDHSVAILSPLTERTTPVSFSSFDNQTDPPSMTSSYVTVVPAPLADDLYNDCSTIEVLPYAPPQFAGDDPAKLDLAAFTGRAKGIAGSTAVHSGFIESIIYLLSISTDLLVQHLESSYPDIRNLLIESVVLPLQRGELVGADVMADWKEAVVEISTGRMLPTEDIRELHKFLNILLQHIISIPPLYELNNQQTGYAMDLVACQDARVGFPSIQILLEKTCIQRKVKLMKVPDYLILIVSRYTMELVFPNLHIDLTDVLEYARRICHMCGERAVFECPECYEHELADLSAAAFCESCSQTVHRHAKRANHLPVQLKGDEESLDEGAVMLLKGILTVRDGHYVSVSEPSGLASTDTNEWLRYDSRAHNQDTTGPAEQYIPEVSALPDLANWLSMDAYNEVARDINSIPDDIQRLLQDCCLCVYSKS